MASLWAARVGGGRMPGSSISEALARHTALGDGRWSPGAGAAYLGQQPRVRPAAARLAAPAVAGASRGGAAGAFLLSWRCWRLPDGAQNIHGFAQGSWPPRRAAGTRRTLGGLYKTLCPPDLLPRLRSAARDLGARLLPVLLSSPASVGRSIPVALVHRVSLAPTPEERALCLGLRSRGSLGRRSSSSPQSLFSPNLSLSTNSTNQLPSPDQWQRRAQAEVPAPSAAASWTRTFQGIPESSYRTSCKPIISSPCSLGTSH